VPRLLPTLYCTRGRACGLLALLAAAAAHAGDPAGNPPVLRGPQVMMYFQLPIGHSAQPLAMYGLRIEQTRLESAAVPTALVQTPYHQQLLDLQLRPHADMQIEFGRRVTWYFGRESFSAPSRPSAFTIRWPIDGAHSAEALPRALINHWPQPGRVPPDP